MKHREFPILKYEIYLCVIMFISVTLPIEYNEKKIYGYETLEITLDSYRFRSPAVLFHEL